MSTFYVRVFTIGGSGEKPTESIRFRVNKGGKVALEHGKKSPYLSLLQEGFEFQGETWALGKKKTSAFLARLPLMLSGRTVFATATTKDGRMLFPSLEGKSFRLVVLPKMLPGPGEEIEKEKAKLHDVHQWATGPHIKIKEPNVWVPYDPGKHKRSTGSASTDESRGHGSMVEGKFHHAGIEPEIARDMRTKDFGNPETVSEGSLNFVFRAEMGGNEVFVKPDLPMYDPWKKKKIEMKNIRGSLVGDDTPMSHREAFASDLNKMLGFGVVPTTIARKMKIPKDVVGDVPALQQGKQSRGETFMSIQQAVGDTDATSYRCLYPDEADDHLSQSKSYQEIAMLDMIMGNTDRHGANIRLDNIPRLIREGKSTQFSAHAIDNAMIMPNIANKDNMQARAYRRERFRREFRSDPLRTLALKKRQIDPKVREAVLALNPKNLDKLAKAYGFNDDTRSFADKRIRFLQSKLKKKDMDWKKLESDFFAEWWT